MAMPGSLLGVGEPVGQDRDAHREQRGGDLRAEQRAVALVVGVGHEGHARGEQLGPGGLDLERPPAIRRAAKRSRWYAPGSSLSSISAWDTAVWKSTSHCVGASVE